MAEDVTNKRFIGHCVSILENCLFVSLIEGQFYGWVVSMFAVFNRV